MMGKGGRGHPLSGTRETWAAPNVPNILAPPETLNASGSRRACRMASSRDATPLPDFFEKMNPAGRSSPQTYQTRRAWASFVRATEVTRHGTATWTWLHAPRDKTSLEFRRNRMRLLLPSAGGAEAVVVVTVRRGVPVTVRRADVRRLIVERPAPKDTRVWSSPAEKSLCSRSNWRSRSKAKRATPGLKRLPRAAA